MPQIDGSLYLVNGKVFEVITGSGMGLEMDQKVESQETEIVASLKKYLKSYAKESHKNVVLVFFEGKWSEKTLKFLDEPKIDFKIKNMTPEEFKRVNFLSNAFDKKNSLTLDPTHLVFLGGKNVS